METIAVANEKGGCGKTSTVVMLANGLTALGYRVLLVDFDPSGNLTSNILSGAPKNVIYDVFMGDCELTDAIYHTEVADILPTRRELMFAPITAVNAKKLENDETDPVVQKNRSLTDLADKLKAGNGTCDPIELLKRFLRSKKHNLPSIYDFVIVDTPASDDLLTKIALFAADRVIVATTVTSDGADGTMKCFNTIGMIQRQTSKPLNYIDGIVLTMFPGGSAEQLEDAYVWAIGFFESVSADLGIDIYNTRLRQSKSVKDALTHCLPILADKYIYSGGSHAPEDTINFALEFLQRRGLEPKATPDYVKNIDGKWCWKKPAPKCKKKQTN